MKKSSVEISGAEAIILQRPGFAGAAPRDKERWLLHEHGYGSLRVSLDPSLWRGALEPPGRKDGLRSPRPRLSAGCCGTSGAAPNSGASGAVGST